MCNEYDIFKFLIPNHNDMLSCYEKEELKEILYYIGNYFLEYRNCLKLGNNVTFGVEIESENLLYSITGLSKILSDDLLSEWVVCDDFSLKNGCEVKSPKLTNSYDNWVNLARICSILRKYTRIDKNCGGHIHIGSQILGKKSEYLLNFIKLWAAYEKVIYRFCYGEYLTHRPKILFYSNMLSYSFFVDYNKLRKSNLSFEEIVSILSHDTKNQAVNLKNVGDPFKNTVEFRCANATLNPIVWQNNINLFVHLLLYSRSSSFDDDIVSRRFWEINEKRVKLANYKKIFIKEAIELSDLIFDNNIDKVYFLRQYLKDYQIGKTSLVESKPFVRSLN